MGLAERENKRKQSIVGTIVSDAPKNPDPEIEIQDKKNIISKPKTETRSKRINLLVTPSIYVKAQEKCDQIGISLNECVNQFLTNWVNE